MNATNSLPQVKGHIEKTPTTFLLDSGAAVSVIHTDALPDTFQEKVLTRSPHLPVIVGANGLALDVTGQVTLPIVLGGLQLSHSFSIVRHLPVDCLLGADFLIKNQAIIDCNRMVLQLGINIIPITGNNDDLKSSLPTTEGYICAPKNIQIPGRTVQLIKGSIKLPDQQKVCTDKNILIEPLNTASHSHILTACSISRVDNNQMALIQVMNTSPDPFTLYKGSRLAMFLQQQNVMVVTERKLVQTPNLAPTVIPTDSLNVGSHLSPSQREQLFSLLQSFHNVFSSPQKPYGRTNAIHHSIETTGPPIRQPLRRVPYSLQDTINTEVEKMLDNRVIRPSTSPWSSPVVLVRKGDGSWRFCVDFRKVNDVTRKDAYPLPRIDSTVESLRGSVYFTTLDLASGYWQVELDEKSKEKTAFSVPSGHYEFNVMPFGLTNAPATFQRVMECILSGLNNSECLIYLDDVIVFSTSFQEHLQRLQTVLTKLRDAGLLLKLSKCKFAQEEVPYLGFIVSSKGVRPNPDKVKAVLDYPNPANPKALRQFLGMTNYYRRFIQGYSQIAESLHRLT